MSLAITNTAQTPTLAVGRLLTFWLPVLVLGTLVIRNDTRMEYAEAAIGTLREYRDEATEVGAATLERQLLFLSFGAIGALLLWMGRKQTQRPVYWPILLSLGLLFTYGCGTAVWSDAPFTTIKRMVVVGCIMVGGIGIGKTWNARDLCHAIICWSTTFLLIGIAAELYCGTFLAMGDYRFSGMFHPAKQAFSCAFLFLACSCMYQAERRRIYLVIAGVAFAFLVLTKARSGTAACILAGLWLWSQHLPKQWMLRLCFAGGLFLCAGIFYLGATGAELEVSTLTRMGRKEDLADPTTLTGRWPIWKEALGQAVNQPLLGYGYGAFWIPERVRVFERHNGWAFSHAHSIYIESLVNLGMLGLFLILLVVVNVSRRCLFLTKTNNFVGGRFVFSLIILAAISGIAESAFVNDGYEPIMLSIGFALVAFNGPFCHEEWAA